MTHRVFTGDGCTSRTSIPWCLTSTANPAAKDERKALVAAYRVVKGEQIAAAADEVNTIPPRFLDSICMHNGSFSEQSSPTIEALVQLGEFETVLTLEEATSGEEEVPDCVAGGRRSDTDDEYAGCVGAGGYRLHAEEFRGVYRGGEDRIQYTDDTMTTC